MNSDWRVVSEQESWNPLEGLTLQELESLERNVRLEIDHRSVDSVTTAKVRVPVGADSGSWRGILNPSNGD